MSIGYWQASRIHALLGRADEARRYRQLCLRYSQQEEAFYLGYAYEALARAEKVAGNSTKAQEFLAEASRLAVAVADPKDRKLLLDDLADLAGQP